MAGNTDSQWQEIQIHNGRKYRFTMAGNTDSQWQEI
jgi:hypothetical protein